MKRAELLARVVSSPDTCWLWTGGQNGGYGSARITEDGRTRQVHAVTYEALVGPVPAGLELDHLCRTPLCCNPAHLEPVTHAENMRRGLIEQRKVETSRSRTECRNGHPYDEANTRITPQGRRRCRACNAAWARTHRAAA